MLREQFYVLVKYVGIFATDQMIINILYCVNISLLIGVIVYHISERPYR